jgi:PAS domain S-box-containing protein
MTLTAILRGREGIWNAAIIVTTFAALGANLAGLLVGFTVVLPHLLYIPVVITSYRYPRQGLLFAACIGGAYLLMTLLIGGGTPAILGEALVRTGVVIGIGWLIAVLTRRLREEENLYQGLFDHSEAGSVLIRVSENKRMIEEINEKAAELLRMQPEDLTGGPLTLFWDRKDEENFFGRLVGRGKITAEETVFSPPDGGSLSVLVSIAPVSTNRAILTFVNITRRVAAEQALQSANDKLSLLARISTDHISRTANEIIGTVDAMAVGVRDTETFGWMEGIRTQARTLIRQLFLTRTYQSLGSSPPVWIPVQKVLDSARPAVTNGEVSFRYWAERLEIYADPIFSDVLTHIIDNSFRHGGIVRNVVVTYRATQSGLLLTFADDGVGIPNEQKERIFEYDAGGHAGIGLFICRQILGVTGMTITENGTEGNGARFVINVPGGNYRIEGTSEDAPPLPIPSGEVVRGSVHTSGTRVRELLSAEFPIADRLWLDYHETKGDPKIDRIFAAFRDGEAVSLARCRRHRDGLELDGVFTPVHHRGHGYANAAVWGLVEACGQDPLFMHSVLNLTGFYRHYGFVPIGEDELPPTIRERFSWAGGALDGANVSPMRRDAAK